MTISTRTLVAAGAAVAGIVASAKAVNSGLVASNWTAADNQRGRRWAVGETVMNATFGASLLAHSASCIAASSRTSKVLSLVGLALSTAAFGVYLIEGGRLDRSAREQFRVDAQSAEAAWRGNLTGLATKYAMKAGGY